MHRPERILALLGALAMLSACVIISREHTVEREPPRPDHRYQPPPAPPPAPAR